MRRRRPARPRGGEDGEDGGVDSKWAARSRSGQRSGREPMCASASFSCQRFCFRVHQHHHAHGFKLQTPFIRWYDHDPGRGLAFRYHIT